MKSSYGNDIRVGIVGGSIAGCVAAVELLRIGCQVTIFERSYKTFEDRGAGIASSVDHLDLLKKRDLVDNDIPVLPLNKRLWTEGAGKDWRVIWQSDIAVCAMNWGIIFANHRKRIPDRIYFSGQNVVGLDENHNTVSLELASGNKLDFDIVIFADGYKSWGRRYLYPELEMTYAGYIVWRGNISNTRRSPEFSTTQQEYAVHRNGHCVAYTIPVNEKSGQRGQHLNWAWYDMLPEKDLSGLLVDRYGRIHTTSLPQGSATTEHFNYLNRKAMSVLRKPLADMIKRTKEPYIQVIYDIHVPSYRRGRICLLGDASSIARPHTGAGAIKAQEQAISLAKSLWEESDIDKALQTWNTSVWQKGNDLYQFGKRLGKALVTEAPDWTIMDERQMENWWRLVIQNTRVHYFDVKNDRTI